MKNARSRTAAFKSAVAYCEPGGRAKVFEGKVSGTIVNRPVGANGFGFDPIFLPERSPKTMGQLTVEEKCRISHRAEAMRKFAQWFLKA